MLEDLCVQFWTSAIFIKILGLEHLPLNKLFKSKKNCEMDIYLTNFRCQIINVYKEIQNYTREYQVCSPLISLYFSNTSVVSVNISAVSIRGIVWIILTCLGFQVLRNIVWRAKLHHTDYSLFSG